MFNRFRLLLPGYKTKFVILEVSIGIPQLYVANLMTFIEVISQKNNTDPKNLR